VGGLVFLGKARGREEGNPGLTEKMIEGLDLDFASNRRIGKHEIKTPQSEGSEKSFRLVSVADHLDGLWQSHRWYEQVVADKLWQHV
jgi:hypothetical protein